MIGSSNRAAEAPRPSRTGRVCMVTGANGGLGEVVATELAQRGATVVLVCRREPAGRALQQRIQAATGNTTIDLLVADLSDQSDIRRLADQFHLRHSSLHVLINNAGAQFPTRQLSVDGIELHLAVNFLAPFLLTNLLLDTLVASAPARIVNVASEVMADARMIKLGGTADVPFDLEDLQSERRFTPMRAYGQAKLALVMSGYRLARQLEGSGVTVNALHPGVVATGITEALIPRPLRPVIRLAKPFLRLRTPEVGAQTIVHLATEPELASITGKYFIDGREQLSPAVSYDQLLQERLWERSTELVGLTPTDPLALDARSTQTERTRVS
jgi:NAD(P)-dependent dehydrogenase (short-subunit alcohol dehydrogenase family)